MTARHMIFRAEAFLSSSKYANVTTHLADGRKRQSHFLSEAVLKSGQCMVDLNGRPRLVPIAYH
jgi:hypothetical protein